MMDGLRDKSIPSNQKQMTAYETDSRGVYCEYCGETQWKRYCEFINSVLETIRSGEEDYCFYPYQIAELLRFEQGLIAEYLPDSGCVKVSLIQYH